jgi:fimbrial chaperone protein
MAGLASAAQFGLNQTRLHLSRGHAVETLVLTNQEDQAVSFEVEVKRWRQDEQGRWQLAPSDALLVHPLILTIPAGQQARLRVGSLSPNVAQEEAYRVELQQLPGAVAADTVQIRMLTRLSVPVFLQPPAAKAAPALDVRGIADRSLQLTVRNTGTAYLAPHDTTLRVFDAQGRSLHEGKLTVGYTLAGAQLHVATALPAGACARAARVELTLDKALPPLDAPIADSVRRCSR